MIDIIKLIAINLIISNYIIAITLLAIDINMGGLNIGGLGGLKTPSFIHQSLVNTISKIAPTYQLR